VSHVGPFNHRLASGRLAIHHDVPMICAHALFPSFLIKRSSGWSPLALRYAETNRHGIDPGAVAVLVEVQWVWNLEVAIAQTSEFKTIQAGTAMVDMAMAPLVTQGYRPILMSTGHDAKGAIIVVVILEKAAPMPS
jgi:hypothetical protein